MARFAKGIPYEKGKVPLYEGDEYELPDPRTLDLAQKEELTRQYTKEIADAKAKHDKYQELKKRKNEKQDQKPPTPSDSDVSPVPKPGGQS